MIFINKLCYVMYAGVMKTFASLLSNLQAVIAVKAARERTLTVMLVGMVGVVVPPVSHFLEA